jgi:hypothetical protein
MLSRGEGIPYAHGSKRVEKTFSDSAGLSDPMGSLPILLFLERMIPSGWGHEKFLRFSKLMEQLKSQTEDDGTLVYLQPNPWICIAPNTWPFVIRSPADQSVPLEVWPENARHDSPRWIRSKESGLPLGTFSIRVRGHGQLGLMMDFHVDLTTPVTASLEDVERAIAHRMVEEQWEADWETMTQEQSSISDSALALCAFQRALLVEHPTFLPCATPDGKAEYIKTILQRIPGIEQTHPVAANAMAQIQK